MPRSLPANPSVRFLQTEAKRMLKSQRKGDADTCDVYRCLERFKNSTNQEILQSRISLQMTQFALALSYGFKGWNQLLEQVRSLQSFQSTLWEAGAPNEKLVAALRDEGFDSPIESVRRIENPHGINDIYLVEHQDGKAILRVWKLSSPSQAIAQLKALQRLEESGFPRPRRLLPSSPERTLTVADRPAALFEFIEGNHPPRNTVQKADVELSAQIGTLVARAHVALAGLEHLDYRVQSYSHYLRERVSLARTLNVDDAAGAKLSGILDIITREGQELSDNKQLPVGVIHDDPGPWNVLIRNGSVVALLDSESLHRDFLTYDIAHVIGQWGGPSDTSGFDADAVRSIVDAYSSVRPLTTTERRALARAVPLRHAIQLLAMLVNVLDQPDWNLEDFLSRFDVMALCDDSDWLGLFM